MRTGAEWGGDEEGNLKFEKRLCKYNRYLNAQPNPRIQNENDSLFFGFDLFWMLCVVFLLSPSFALTLILTLTLTRTKTNPYYRFLRICLFLLALSLSLFLFLSSPF
jgi:hypothetical protein